jgi:hypothetical protein
LRVYHMETITETEREELRAQFGLRISA